MQNSQPPPASTSNKSRKQTPSRTIGSRAEDRAALWLEKQGYILIERNFTIPGGEIDFIAQKDGKIIFIELKWRTSSFFGSPEESFTARKQKILLRTAKVWCMQKRHSLECVRFDFLAGEKSQANEDTWRLYENVELQNTSFS